MTSDIQILLLLLLGATIGFAFEILSADVVALALMLMLVSTGLLTPELAFAGFGSETVMMILGLLIMTAALLKTGVVEICGKKIVSFGGKDGNHLMLIIMLGVALLSAFISNTAATAFFLPVVFGIAARTGQSTSKLLMPLAFASILTSSVTLVSTSTNLVVSEIMTRYGMAPMGMFELSPIGLPIAVAGLIYMWTIGRRMIPERAPVDRDSIGTSIRQYILDVKVLTGSPLIGRSLSQTGLGKKYDLTVLWIVRKDKHYIVPRGASIIHEGDVLVLRALPDDIKGALTELNVSIVSSPDLPHETRVEDLRIVEAVVQPGSPLIGRTLEGANFRENYQVQVLGIDHGDQQIRSKMSQVRLRMGDLLLLQGHTYNIEALRHGRSLKILSEIDAGERDYKRAHIAILIFITALTCASIKVVSLPVAALMGALFCFVTGCITPEEAYSRIDWKIIILIGCMLSLGKAMETTGADKYLAGSIIEFIGTSDPRMLVAGFFILTIVLTQPMSNQAAAVVVLPVALQAANNLGLNPRTFAMTIAVAASCSFITPLEPSCLMVYGPGRYRFFDFVKVGTLLTVVIFVISMLLVPYFWPLHLPG